MTSPTTERRYGVVGSVPMKAPCRAATTTNITLSGLQSIDGITVASGDRVLVKNQTTATQNGIYVVDTGDWSRSVDANGNYDLVQGTMVLVNSGSTNASTIWQITTSGTITIGTSSISFQQGLFSGLGSTQFLQGGTGAVYRGAQGKMREIVSVMDWIPEGTDTSTTNCTTYIQDAIDSLSSGGKLYFPKGTYRINTGLTMKSAVSLVGDGMDSTVIRYYGSGTALDADGTSGDPFVKIGIHDLALYDNGTGVNGLFMDYCHYSTFRNLRIHGFTVGVAVSNSWNDEFDFVLAESNSQDGFNLSTTNANALTLIGCQAVSNGRAGLYSSGGRAVACYGCTFEANTSYGVYLDGGASSRPLNHVFHGCYFEGNGIFEFYSDTATAYVPYGTMIRDCYFEFIAAKAATAIRLVDAQVISIEGCTFDNQGGNYTNSLYMAAGGTLTGIRWGNNSDSSTSGVYSEVYYKNDEKLQSRAWGRFTVSGAAIATQNCFGASVGYVGTGIYEVTLTNAQSGTDYGVVATAENGASYNALLCSVAPSTSTTVFRIATASGSTSPAEARTVSFAVFS